MQNINLYSQNISQKKWNSNNFDLVFLELDFTGNLTVNKSTSNNICVKYKQEGEFKEKTILKTTIKNKELYIQEMASPTSKSYNDKLSVHKTIANSIEVSVPINFKTIIKTRFCNINIMSSFSDINIMIDDGKINLNQNKIIGEIKSISANIFCVNPFSKILVSSKADFVSGFRNSIVMPNLVIRTVRGNISDECFIN